MPLFAPNDNPEAPQPKEMVELEMTFEKLEKEVKIVNKNAEELKRTYLNLTELRSMLKKTQQFFDEVCNFINFFKNLLFPSPLPSKIYILIVVPY